MRPRCSGSDLGTHSATPLSGTSTLKHAITVKSGVFCSPERCCETGTTSGCIPCGGVQPCLVCGRNTLALNPQPEQNLFLALPYLPSILPFFWFLPPTYSLTATAEKKAGGGKNCNIQWKAFLSNDVKFINQNSSCTRLGSNNIQAMETSSRKKLKALFISQ